MRMPTPSQTSSKDFHIVDTDMLLLKEQDVVTYPNHKEIRRKHVSVIV